MALSSLVFASRSFARVRPVQLATHRRRECGDSKRSSHRTDGAYRNRFRPSIAGGAPLGYDHSVLVGSKSPYALERLGPVPTSGHYLVKLLVVEAGKVVRLTVAGSV
jgi:hypothetical protein